MESLDPINILELVQEEEIPCPSVLRSTRAFARFHSALQVSMSEISPGKDWLNTFAYNISDVVL